MVGLRWMPVVVLAALLFSCGASDAGGGRDVETPAGDGDDTDAEDGTNQESSTNGDGDASAGLVVRFEKVGCDGECATITAIASGGAAPYTFRWGDGATEATHTVCESGGMSVSVTDSGEPGIELARPPWTARASVPADLLDCGMATPASCKAPSRIVQAVPSQVTSLNKSPLPEYAGSSNYAGGNRSVYVVAEGLVPDNGDCAQLLLAGSADGAKALGWDDHLLVEYREAPGAPVTKRWQYSAFELSHMGSSVPTVLMPSVAGASLEPPVPNPAAYGYPALSIDLMTQVPAGAANFELSLKVLDEDFVGSTTEIWVIPR
ncbi:MAG: hypothetical protein QM778_04700 [Myxococcales bacterium]